MKNQQNDPDLIKSILIASSANVTCIICKAEEMVLPLDDQPLDADFIATYTCDECEKA